MRIDQAGPTAVLLVLFVLVALGVLPLPAAAQSGQSGSPMTIIPEYGKLAAGATSPDQLFSVLDSDGNGEIDRAEWQTRKMAIFYMRDRNNDIALSRDEVPGLASDRFAEADLNGDGVLSGFEFNQAPFTQFDKADRNTDGLVSRDEFREYIQALSTPR